MTIERHMTVGEVAAAVPEALTVFQALKIDFCCGGKRPLEDALAERDARFDDFVARISEQRAARRTDAEGRDFARMGPAALSHYIEDTHHGYLRRALPEIDALFLHVLRAHGANHAELFDAYALFGRLAAELKQHLIREELLLFPPLARGDAPGDGLADVIVREHEAAGDILERMRARTGGYAVPEDACMSYRGVYEMLEELERDLHQHIHLENNILLKHAG